MQEKRSVGAALLRSGIAAGISDFLFACVSNWFMQQLPLQQFTDRSSGW
jgi:hypothetical protein